MSIKDFDDLNNILNMKGMSYIMALCGFMIKTKSDLKKILLYEKERYFGKEKILFSYIIGVSEKIIIWKFQKNLRKYEYHLNNNHRIRKIIFKYKLLKYRNKFGINIPPNTVKKGLKIMHLGSILINKNASIGENCSMHINTAIVAGGINDEAPNIGNNVIIGIGSTILGKIVIADNCVIGAGAVVNKSFEKEGVTIAGVPAKIISYNGSDTWRKHNI